MKEELLADLNSLVSDWQDREYLKYNTKDAKEAIGYVNAAKELQEVIEQHE